MDPVSAIAMAVGQTVQGVGTIVQSINDKGIAKIEERIHSTPTYKTFFGEEPDGSDTIILALTAIAVALIIAVAFKKKR